MSNLKIFKYQLAITDQQIIELPLEKLLCVQLQGSVPTLWAVVNTEAPCRNVEIRCYGTGHRSPEADDVYLGSVQENAFVWHYFAAARGKSAAPPQPLDEKTVRTEYTDDQRPCLVAKLPCGHYCAAAGIEPNFPEHFALDVKEFRGFGATPEIRPVSFVKSGGLTFNCGCRGTR